MKLRYLNVSNGDHLPEHDGFEPYKAVVICEELISSDWQHVVSQWLADSGCLYMMAWGHECSSWDDSLDWANIESFGYDKIPDDRFICTTWHENEPLNEVIWEAKYAANHPSVELKDLLFLHIGAVDRQREFLQLYNEA